jgi:hypothetical protein
MNLSGSPLFQIFSREDISGVNRENRKIQMANHLIQAYWSIQISHFGPRCQILHSEVDIRQLPETTTFAQDYLVEWHALDPIDNVMYEPNPSECPPYIDVGHGRSKIAIYFLDETGAPGIISEW